MPYLFTPQEVKAMEKERIDKGDTERDMIHRASMALCGWILPYIHSCHAPKVLVVCGSGNNGADGFALSRLLMEEQIPTDVLEVHTGTQTEENMYFSTDVPTLSTVPQFKEYPVIVDAIYGSGFHGKAPENIENLFDEINRSGQTVFSVDLPSGVNGATGQVEGKSIIASQTMNLSALKPGAFVFPGANFCGKISLGADISQSYTSNICAVDGFKLSKRTRRSNKGTYGTVCIVAGCKNMAGAAYFAAKSAYLCGAGLVKIVTEECNRQILQMLLPEAVLFTYDGQTPVNEILCEISSCTSAVVGPGLGKGEKQKELVFKILQSCSLPLVLDADGLNLTAGTNLLEHYKGSAVITPHPGEAARIMEMTVSEILSSPIDCLKKMCEKFPCTVLLKDAHTLIGKGDKIYVNLSGNDGMATGGCGDVLSGMIGALLPNFEDSAMAATTAAFIHGCAGDQAAKKHGKRSMLATHVLECIEDVLREE